MFRLCVRELFQANPDKDIETRICRCAGEQFLVCRGAERLIGRDPIDACNALGYTTPVAIKSFRHKGLRRFFESGSAAGIQAKHTGRLRLILGRLNAAAEPRDMGLPGLGLHPLRGDRAGTWAVKVSGNWRVTFRFSGRDAEVVDYEDYH